VSAGRPEAPPERAHPALQAGVTRRQFLVGGGIVVAGVAALPEPSAGGFEPGGHNDAYWLRVAPPEVDFIGRVLGGASPGA